MLSNNFLNSINVQKYISQGTTVKAGCNYKIHWCENMQDGMAYVMLGRPERLEDLFISENYDPSQIKCDVTYSLPESKRLDKVYDDAIQLKKEERDKCWKISYLNVFDL